MNIALLLPGLGGGGAERAAQRMGDYWMAQGHQVYYFLGDFGIPQKYRVKGTIIHTGIQPIYGWRRHSFLLTLDQLRQDAQKLKALKRRYRIDVSISFMEQFGELNILSRAQDKVIVGVRTMLSMRSFSGYIYSPRMIRLLYPRADVVQVLTEDGAMDMRRVYGVPASKLRIIPNFASCAKKSQDVISRMRRQHYNDHIVISIGRLEKVKQQDHLIRAFSLVVKEIPDAQLVLLGQGILQPYLEKIVASYQLQEHVHFAGFVTDMEPFFEKASVMVMTSHCEGFPNSMIEAMAWGIPVVASESPGGVREILAGTVQGEKKIKRTAYGILTPALKTTVSCRHEELQIEERLLAEAIRKILTDCGLFDALCRASIQRAQDYAEEGVMKKWKEVIEA